jgi:hypothetical protein
LGISASEQAIPALSGLIPVLTNSRTQREKGFLATAGAEGIAAIPKADTTPNTKVFFNNLFIIFAL